MNVSSIVFQKYYLVRTYYMNFIKKECVCQHCKIVKYLNYNKIKNKINDMHTNE